ncbi:hypothetical protein EJ08DRAFT_697147 [Tothia fuscella]|uniref:Uncharacterized protein n=1 Tax=Tothia fuscella TaxID=1048955 RepID=A0A9P4TXT0_9PEZI|nr:hypothetical protein EJ08DRAFT_697147 [Tothia fuscella]
MLSFKSLPILVTSLAVLASAAPTTEIGQGWVITEGTGFPQSDTLMKRAPGGVYICTDVNWKGTCGYKVQPLNTCIGLDFPWWQSISSFGPDQGTKCDLYHGYSCDDWIATGVGAPGYADLRTFANANDRIGSFICRT